MFPLVALVIVLICLGSVYLIRDSQQHKRDFALLEASHHRESARLFRGYAVSDIPNQSQVASLQIADEYDLRTAEAMDVAAQPLWKVWV